MADVDAAFVQQILHIAKRKRETNVHHHGQAYDTRARLEVTKGGTFCHPAMLIARPARFNVSAVAAPFIMQISDGCRVCQKSPETNGDLVWQMVGHEVSEN
jgi:hypothetical protein